MRRAAQGRSAFAGGVVGTLVLTTMIRAAGELGLTRMDLPFLLGTTLTEDRQRAKAIGYAMHLALGIMFGLGDGWFFASIGRSSWWPGALLGGCMRSSRPRYSSTCCCPRFTRGWPRQRRRRMR